MPRQQPNNSKAVLARRCEPLIAHAGELTPKLLCLDVLECGHVHAYGTYEDACPTNILHRRCYECDRQERIRLGKKLGRRRIPIDIDTVASMVSNNVTVGKIAKAIGVTAKTIRRYLKEERERNGNRSSATSQV